MALRGVLAIYNGQTKDEEASENGTRQGRRFYERKTPMKVTLLNFIDWNR
jgi:hypothetical protein